MKNKMAEQEGFMLRACMLEDNGQEIRGRCETLSDRAGARMWPVSLLPENKLCLLL